MTAPVSLGFNSVAWPEYEIIQINKARIAGGNRFNSRLDESGVSYVLFAEVNSQLSKAGILIFPSEGALVDPKIRISP